MNRLLFVAALCVAASATTASADNWPQWRGPKNDGVSAEKGLPTEWGADKNVVWKLEMPGMGAGTPVVWGNKIFLTSVAGDEIVLLCAGTDGKEKWRTPISATGATRYKNPSGADASDASASCSTDGKHVWAFSGNGTLACFTVDGKEVWKGDLQQYGKFRIQFGIHWTPVLYKGKLYLQVMHRGAQLLVALDALTGKEVWKVERRGYGKGESPDVYASAFIWEGEGGPLLVAHGNDYCTGHKLTDGSEVWRVTGLNPKSSGAWRFVSNPLVTPDLIVVPSCKDGPTVGFNPVGAKGDIDPDNKAELWRQPASASFRTPDVVAPVRVGDVLYVTGHGPFWALEAKTGKVIYKENLSRGSHWANLLAGDGKVYVTAQDGTTDVIATGKQFKRLATNALPDKVFAGPAAADGRLYFRGYNYLWAIGAK
ncbi:MAG TPA: PQQ-binding-like beta-propeller repeat protein [Gemmata sp.]